MQKNVFQIFYQNRYSILLFEATFCKHNQENFQFLFLLLDSAATQGDDCVFQRLELLVADSLCPPHRRVEWGFLLILSFPSCQTLLVKSAYQSLV